MISMIARDMMGQALQRGSAVRELGRGLRLEMEKLEGGWLLKLSRPAVPVGEDEVDVCRRAFEVPSHAEMEDLGGEVLLRWMS